VFSVGNGIIFFAAAVFARGARCIIGRAPSARSNDQRQKRAELRRGGWRDLNYDVSILISPSEEARGARPRSNVSMTIMRPPQHGHGCARTRSPG
jgi:hypothetical protein